VVVFHAKRFSTNDIIIFYDYGYVWRPLNHETFLAGVYLGSYYYYNFSMIDLRICVLSLRDIIHNNTMTCYCQYNIGIG